MFGLGVAELAVLVVLVGGSPLPLGLPPLAADPLIERATPKECLFYTSWNGTAAPDPKSDNAVEQLLAEPEVQEFGQELAAQIQKTLTGAAKGDPRAAVLADTVPVLLKTLARRPGAFYVSDVTVAPTQSVSAALVVSAGDEGPKLREALARLEGLLAGELGDRAKIEPAEIAGVELKRLALPGGAPAMLWGFRGELFILAVGEQETKSLIERLANKHDTPEWLSDIRDELEADRPVGTMYVNLAKILELAKPFISDPSVATALDTLGISKLDYLAVMQGLEDEGLVARTLLAIDGEPSGLLKLIPAKPLALEDLNFVPRKSTFALVARFDLEDAYRTGLAIATALDPKSAERFQENLGQAEQQFGLRLVDDLLKPLGDRWTLYSSSEEGGSLWTLGGLVASITLDDASRFTATHDRLLAMAQNIINGQPKPPAQIRQSTVDGVKVYTVQPNVPFFMAPSWAITKDRVVFTLNRQMMRAVLRRPSHGKSLAGDEDVAETIKEGPSVFSYQDTAELVASIYPLLQILEPLVNGTLAQQGVEFELPTLPSLSVLRRHLKPAIGTLQSTDDGFLSEQYTTVPVGLNMATTIPFTVGLALPAIQKAREQGRRQAATNNLRQLELALINVDSLDGHLPAPAINDDAGKPLLSWRVAILPILGEEQLYRSFHLNESWDSPHNRQLLGRMPKAFGDAAHPELAAAGRTRYEMPVGPGTLFSGGRGPSLGNIPDGSSNTIMLLQAPPEAAVEWTRPQDLTIDPKNPTASLKLAPSGQIQVGMADGSVQTIGGAIDVGNLRRLFDPADGQVVDNGPLR